MPNKINCSTCYKPIIYEVSKPIYCPYCSKPINAAFEVIVNNKSITTATDKHNIVANKKFNNNIITKINSKGKRVKYMEVEVDDNDEDINNDENNEFDIPIIDRIEVNYQGVKKESLGSLLQAPDNSQLGTRREEKLPSIPDLPDNVE